jgi:hypothetical protein
MAIPVVSFCGREFSGAEVQLIAALVQRCAGLSRVPPANQHEFVGEFR